MDKTCDICDSTFKTKKIKNGILCGSCFKRLPFFLKPHKSRLSLETASAFLSYSEQAGRDGFRLTSHYGALAVDETRGIIGLADSEKTLLKIDKPSLLRRIWRRIRGTAFDSDTAINSGKIFLVPLEEIDGIGLYCKSPTANKKGVFCDIEFSIRIDSIGLDKAFIVKRRASCPSKRKDATHLVWDEPGTLSVFRNIIQGMIDGRTRLLSESQKVILRSERDIATVRAMALFMVEDGYTRETLRHRRNVLLKAFHPDISELDGASSAFCTRAITESYKILEKRLHE